MNYFAHGRHVIDRPYVLAGTAVPDWLGMCGRKARIRRSRLADGKGDVATGIRSHLRQDAWFHRTRAFLEVSGELTRELRGRNDDPRLRAAFFGHVLTEMLLDAVLIADEPGCLDAYYDALDRVDAARVEEEVGAWVAAVPVGLARCIDRFRRYRFLASYPEDEGLRARVHGLAGRIGIDPPRGLRAVIPAARRLVEFRAADLLEAPT